MNHESKRHLVVFRCGDSPLLQPDRIPLAQRSWDYAVSTYSENSDFGREALFLDRHPGPKWKAVHQCMSRYQAQFSNYDYIWFPDDDLEGDETQINTLFEAAQNYELDLCQPALTHNSYWNHVTTLEHSLFHLRFTNFVEVMAPMFSRAMLDRVEPYFESALSGWGLDAIFPTLTELGAIAVVDHVRVRHARPVGTGSIYAFNERAGITPQRELNTLMARKFLPSELRPINFGGVLKTGNLLALSPDSKITNHFFQSLLQSVAEAGVPPIGMAVYIDHHLAALRERPVQEIAQILSDRLLRLVSSR
ncbi:MAG: DUF707 domain-containing protein [Burkholderiales bacterium]|nr:DUF707 domain-containing protein [Burkholderiales bacterium]MDE2395197.1 DUF707 domain-containing protein [Burkholderiales bacterium]